MSNNLIEQKAEIIKRILEISFNSKEGHIGSSLSILDILFVFYKNFNSDDEILILSKGHASIGLYAIMEKFEILEEKLDTFCKFDSNLGGHPSNKIKGVVNSSGSLGHGLPIAIGLALSEKIKDSNKKIFVIIGDGESNEGTIWESALLAAHHRLDNLYCVIDYNRSNDRALKLDSLVSKFESFGWFCTEIDGHNHDEINKSFSLKLDGKPSLILANTIKGKGLPEIENNPAWHHKSPSEEELNRFSDYLSIQSRKI